MGSGVASTLSPTAYWYLARGTGVVSLLLLTVAVVLGILGSVRFAAPRWPRFAVETVHRDVSLLVLVVIAVHVLTSVLDGFAPIRLIDGLLPFLSGYRPLWLGLGTLSFDLLLAIAITSIIRRRLGYAAWRAVHWLAYASWPVAVLHGLGSGSDIKQWWMLALSAACLVAVLVAVWVRIASSDSDPVGLRVPATALTVITPVGLAIFALAGPLHTGWARRAGTPPSLLAKPSTTATRASAPVAAARASKPLRSRFTANLNGTITQTATSGGAIVELSFDVSGQVRGRMRVRLGGLPIGGGGLSMTGSQVDLAVVGQPSALQGQITALQGQEFNARLSGAAGARVKIHVVLQIDTQSSQVTGTMSGSRV